MAGCQWPTVPCRNCFADVVCSSSGEACWQCCGVFCLWLWVWSLCTVHGNWIKLNFDSHKLFCRDMMYITSRSFVICRLIDFELWCYGKRYAQGWKGGISRNPLMTYLWDFVRSGFKPCRRIHPQNHDFRGTRAVVIKRQWSSSVFFFRIVNLFRCSQLPDFRNICVVG